MPRLFGKKDKAPPPREPRTARAVCDYDPQAGAGADAFAAMRGGISLRAGQAVLVQSDDNPASWYVRTERGEQGFVPSSVLQLEQPPPGVAAEPAAAAAAAAPPPVESYETGVEAQMDALMDGSPEDPRGQGSMGSGGSGAGGMPGVGLQLRDSLRSSLASNASERPDSFSDRAGSVASATGMDTDGHRFGSIEESPPRGVRDPPAGPRASSGRGQWADSELIAPPSRSSPDHDPWAGQPEPARRGGGGAGEDQWGAQVPPPRRGHGGREGGLVVCLDWDCTVTERHMHKDTGNRSQGGMHSAHFEEWCQRNGVDSSRSRAGLSAVDRLDFGDDTARVVIDYFLGGAERVRQLTAFFEWLRAQDAQLCILTNGETAAVRQLFEAGFAPWASLFAGGWIANTYDEFFVTAADGRVGEIQRGQFGIGRRLPVDSTKEAILDSFFGGRCTVILIDDSITRDRSFSVAAAEGATSMHCVDLPYEGSGLQEEHLTAVTELVQQCQS